MTLRTSYVDGPSMLSTDLQPEALCDHVRRYARGGVDVLDSFRGPPRR